MTFLEMSLVSQSATALVFIMDKSLAREIIFALNAVFGE